MKPVLSGWPAKKRTLAFAPFALGIFVLAFIILGFATQNFFVALVAAPVLGLGGAYLLVGLPELRRKDGRPLVEAHVRPYLFFVLAPILCFLLYVVLGVPLTAVLPLSIVTYVTMAAALVGGVAAAYFLVGFPNLVGGARKAYAEIPPERRPFLFFPVFVVLFLVIYLALGVVSTQLLAKVQGDRTPLLNLQVLVLLPLTLALAGVLAYLLVGIPKPTKAPTEYLPKVAGRHRPRVFLATFLLLGIPLTLVLGSILTAYAPLPPALTLVLAVLLGFSVSLGVAALSWGTPARWRRYEDYEPGIHPKLRLPLFAGLSVAIGLAVALGFGLAGIDLFWGILVGLLVAGLVLLVLTGTHRAIAARRKEPTLVPDVPDKLKPLILFGTWFLIASVIFAVLTYALPGLVAFNALVGVTVGLLVAFLSLESPLFKDLLDERRREREKRKAWEARRRERLAEATEPAEGQKG